jgi:hypothetical protein
LRSSGQLGAVKTVPIIHQDSGRLLKIQSLYKYIFCHNFRPVYSPQRELSQDKGIISWRGQLNFRACNPWKITKYGLLEGLVHKAKSGYTCSLYIYMVEEE